MVTAADLQLFKFEHQPVRVVLVDGEPWFVLADLCRALAIVNVGNVAARLDTDVKGVHQADTPGGQQNVVIVNESGMYEVVIRSDKKEAARFRRWVTHKVLPEIRRTGSYNHLPAAPRQLPSKKELAQWVVEAEERAELAEAKVAELEPKAEFYDEFMDAEGCYSFKATANALGWGRNVMMRELRRAGVLTGQNLPYQRYAHHFKVVPQTFTRNGETVVTATTYVLPSGMEFLRRKLTGAVAVAVAE